MSKRNLSSVCVRVFVKLLLIFILENHDLTTKCSCSSAGHHHHHGLAVLAFSASSLQQQGKRTLPTSCTTKAIAATSQSLRQNQSISKKKQAVLFLAYPHSAFEDAPLLSLLSDESLAQEPILSDPLPGFGFVAPIIVLVAIGLFIAAQTSINQQLQGDQGLGAFLKDGRGFKGSAFRPVSSSTSSSSKSSPFFKADNERAVGGNDPLPWLALPRLDFVEVAGQKERLLQQQDAEAVAAKREEEQASLEQLELLRLQMNEQLQKGNVAEAMAIRTKLEQIMKDSGIEFQNDFE
jgi:hypothetical protein